MTFNQNPEIEPTTDLALSFSVESIDFELIKSLSGVHASDFSGKFGELHVLYGLSDRKVILLGLGKGTDENNLRKAFYKLGEQIKKHPTDKLQIDATRMTKQQVMLATTGLRMSEYDIGQFKSEKEEQKACEFLFISHEDISESISEGDETGITINRIKWLVDAPSNLKIPTFLAGWATESANSYDFQCKIIDSAGLEEQGFGAIMAVGRGSIHPPVLIEESYISDETRPIDIALVGKGITFDTGGISIKGAQNLHYMKSDMGGAAVVLGVVELAAKLKLNLNIVGIVMAAENAVDANSFRPGDIIHSYSGKTIEVIDTDAEGRLVLADGINYAIQKHNPKQIIDVATLTGSVVRTLGYAAAGIFSKNQTIIDQFMKVGLDINERVWPLPLYDDYQNDLESDIADIKNLGDKPLAGASVAAKFLEYFTLDHKNWAHLDIAGVSFGSSDFTKMKSATGFGVSLFIQYIKTLQP